MQPLQDPKVWQFIQSCLAQQTPVSLLYVVESEGSSPGRKGFHMAAAPDACIGTIGGGIMEYKLVELSRDMMTKGDSKIRLITQYHDKEHTTDQSGMICSGMQRVTLIPMNTLHLDFLSKCIGRLADQKLVSIEITPDRIHAVENTSNHNVLEFIDETHWLFRYQLGTQPKIHIVGAGHVSLAVSELMSRLGFEIIVYDDRPDLNTLQENTFAKEKRIIDYESIGDIIQGSASEYIAIMTIGYRTDKIVLRQLVNKPFRYIGMLGSAYKIQQLFNELIEEGLSKASLERIHAPIGMQIFSKTAYEIAVSIAAEIIRVKNSTGEQINESE